MAEQIIEIWKEIPDHPKYEASTEGRIRNKKTGNVLAPQKSRSRGKVYLKVHLGANALNKVIHRLVLETFEGPPEKGKLTFGCHLNDNPSDNRLVNLKWGNQSTNEVHKTYKPCQCKHEFSDHHDTKHYCTIKNCECNEYQVVKG